MKEKNNFDKLFSLLTGVEKKAQRFHEKVNLWLFGRPITLFLLALLAWVWIWMDPVEGSFLKTREFFTVVILAFLVLKNQIRLFFTHYIAGRAKGKRARKIRSRTAPFKFGFVGVFLAFVIIPGLWWDEIGPALANASWVLLLWIPLVFVMAWYGLSRLVDRADKLLSKW